MNNLSNFYNIEENKSEYVENRHYLPANKEWKNSVYSYNKNIVKETIIKDKNLDKLIKSYFYLSLKKSIKVKSRRMRNRIKRSSTKKIFVSKPEVKQTNDKYIVTVYIYDRQNDLLKRKLYYLNNSITKYGIFKGKNFNEFFKLKKKLNRDKYLYKLGAITKSQKKRLRIKRTLLIKKKKNNYKVKYNIIPKYILPSLLSKGFSIKYFLNFRVLKILLSYFHAKLATKILCYYCKHISDIGIHKRPVKMKCSRCKKWLNTKRSYKFANIYIHNKRVYSQYTKNLIGVPLLNDTIGNFFCVYLNTARSRVYTKKLYLKTFSVVSKTLYKDFVNIYFTRELKLLKRLNLLKFNRFKFNNFMPYLKQLANNVYNKTSEFNIINLKYLHLNSDNLLEALSIKLRKRKSRLIKLLGKVLKLIKIPKRISMLNTDNDVLHNLDNNTVNKILLSIRYKWITGIRLEAKGRLTRRFTASRALFKYVNKGNLKNMEDKYISRYKVSPNVCLLRGQFKPNLQYSHIYSNKRIGTFGLKGWINSI